MSPSSCKDIILSLHNDYYKQIMWSHYRLLGTTRNTDAELQMANTVFSIFQAKLAKTRGNFYKQAGCGNSCRNLEEIDEDTALAKIISHIQRRLVNYNAWSQCEDGVTKIITEDTTAPITKTTKSDSAAANTSTKESLIRNKEINSQSFDENDNSIILSLHNDYYKRIMWSHFRILGKERDLDTEKLIGESVFGVFKKKLSSSPNSAEINTVRTGRRCGKFYKLDKTCASMMEVNDDAALAKIIADIQKRMRNYAAWSVEEVVIDDTTTSGTPYVSASFDVDVSVKVASEEKGIAKKEETVAVVSTNCTPTHSCTGSGTTEQLIDTTAAQHQDFTAHYSTSFNEALQAALDSYHTNNTLLKNDNNPSPPVPPPFLSHEEECTIKTALAFVMARAKLKRRKERNISLSVTPTTGGDVCVGNIDNRCGRPSFLGRLSLLPPPPRLVSSVPCSIRSTFSANNHNIELERKFKHVRDVLKLAVSAVLPFYAGALRVNECGRAQNNTFSSRDDDDATTLEPCEDSTRVGKRPCAVYDYEAAVKSSNTVNNRSQYQYATLDGLCHHILVRLFSLLRDESMKARSSASSATNDANLSARSGEGNSATSKNASANGEAPTTVIDQSRGNTSNIVLRDRRSSKQSGHNFVHDAIVKMIYNDLFGDAYIHHGSLNLATGMRERAERRIEKVMAVCHVLHRLLFLDKGCCLGTECVTAICYILNDLYMNQYRGVKFMKHNRDGSAEKPNTTNENISSVANGEMSRKHHHSSSDGERYQVVSSRWCGVSSRSYINFRHDRRCQSVNTMFQLQTNNCGKHSEYTNEEEVPLPRIGDVLAVNMLRLLEGAAAIRIHHRQQRVPTSASSRPHHSDFMIDKMTQQTATEVLTEIRSSIDHEILLPLHVDDTATFYYMDKLRSDACVRELRSRRKSSVDTTSLVLIQPGAKIMMRLHLFDLTNKLALYEQAV